MYQALEQYNQFIIYQLVPSTTRPGKTDKFPVNWQTLRKHDAHDPAIWLSYANAAAMLPLFGANYGVGFTITDQDPFFFIDIDDCLQADNTWSPMALELCQRFNGAFVEVSQSGKGLHIIGTGTAPTPRECKYKDEFDLYTEKRFIALTGINIIGDVTTQHSPALAQLVTDYLYKDPATVPGDESWTTSPCDEWSGLTDDDALIERALSAVSVRSAMTGGVTFKDLWQNNVPVLAEKWPDDHGARPYDASRADAALAQHLAFWTGKDCERMQRLMFRSALVRDKWTNRLDYMPLTLTRAVSMQKSVHNTRTSDSGVEAASPMGKLEGPELVSGFQFLAASQQMDHFGGCVYIRKSHKILTPDGDMLDQGQFKATYGGYVFSLDATNDKTTKNAWEAFTESQAVRYPKVHDAMFRPDLEPGSIFERNGRRLVNNYVPAKIPMNKGDVTPFLNHLAKVLPVERDREILLAYMAACVQHKGMKFQWTPLLQGVEGNGKTLFSRCVAESLGMDYVSSPRAEEIGNKFNSWMKDKLFVYVEDVYYPDHKKEIIESLKPLITNNYVSVEPKGQDLVLTYVVANFMLNSNHKDAIRKTKNDRRFAVFYTAQQAESDLERDGIDGDYFPKLYKWLREQNGYAIVSEYLNSYNIPDELNPATSCQRAPRTSSTDEVLVNSLGGIEQEILEAIDEGRPGFAGGWISSIALDRLLDSMHASRTIPRNKRREVLQTLGYDWHPRLHNGRVNNNLPLEGGKPKLFIKHGHLAMDLPTPADVARAYSEAQLLTPPSKAATVTILNTKTE